MGWQELTGLHGATIHQVITLLGVYVLADRVGGMKDDVCSREIKPESFVLGHPTPKKASINTEIDRDTETSFDWVFLDFQKSNIVMA